MKVLKNEDDVSDVGNVGLAKPPADCNNGIGITSAVIKGTQKYMITIQIQIILISFSSIIPPKPTQPTLPTPITP